MYRALHGDARAERSGCVPGGGPDPASRGHDRCDTAQHEGADAACGCVAPVARVRGDPSMPRHVGCARTSTRTTPQETGDPRMICMPDTIHYDEMDSPVGRLRLVADSRGLREIWFERERHPKKAHAGWVRAAAPLKFARVQLEEYFAGARQHFELPLHPVGTPFQLEVWEEL